METIAINGVNVYPFSSENELLDYIDEKKGILVAINAEKILHATDRTRSIINRNIGYCDGFGAVLAMHKKGKQNVVKIAGCDLWLKIVEKFYKEKTFYLVGGKQAVIEETVSKLKSEYNGISIVGFRNGYIKSDNERNGLIEDIVLKRPDVVFVAMGSPKQELLMEDIQLKHPAIFQGLGGSFDVYTGHVERAPRWWINHNLEFAYRLIKQPSRIKRQIHLARFLWKLETGRI